MAEDPTGAIVGEFASWAELNTTRLAGNVVDATEVLRLTAHVVDEPGDLQAGDLDELLLDVYPRQVVTADRDQAAGVVPSTRDLLAFLGETGRVRPATVRRLTAELDDVEPLFLAAVMDPAGLDVDEDVDVDDVDLADALGLPDHLPALRLPPEPELAVTARGSERLRRAAELARWVGERRTVTDEEGELSAADAIAAARALGLPGIPAPSAVAGMADLPELLHRWHLAIATELVEFVTDDVVSANAERWPSGDDDDDLDTWSTAFGQTLSSLSLDADLAGREDLDFDGLGALALILFLARSDGLSLTELGELAREAATDELAPAEEGKAWDSWVEAHGDPARTMLARLAEHGAVELGAEDGEETARLTPLGMWAMRHQLAAAGVTVPLLPPVEEMTAADLVAAADGLAEDELEAETEQWLALRSPETAVGELLDAAAAAEPAERLFATALVGRFGAAAEPRWRGALEQPELRPYAKLALNQLAGMEPPAFQPGLQPLPDDLAWLLTDVLAATFDADGDDEIEVQFRDAVPQGQEQAVFDAMWRLPHPAVADVLTLLGERHPDKKVAKAARKAAFKASSAAR